MQLKNLAVVRSGAFYLWCISMLLVCTLQAGAQNVVSVRQQYEELADTLATAVVTAKPKPSSSLQGTPLQVMQQKHFAALGAKELYEAVKTFSGIQIKDYGGIGGVKTVSVRSLGTQHTAISYDGVTVSNAQSGQVDIGRFNLDNVEMITLSIGQVEDIFQTARMYASAGVLNITTARPRFSNSNVNVGASMRVGSFGTFNPSAYWQQRLGSRWIVAVNADWLKSDGEYPYTLKNGNSSSGEKRLNSDVNTIRAEANVYGELENGGEITFKGNWMSYQRGLPGSVIYYNHDARERLWDEAGFVQSHYRRALSPKWELKGQLKYNYAWNKYRDENESYQGGERTDYYTQKELYGSVSVKYTPAGYWGIVLSQDIFRNTLEASYENFVYPKRFTSLTALATRFDNGRVNATASLLSTVIAEELETGSPAPDRFRLSPSVSVSYKPFKGKNLRIRCSWQDIFRTPTFNDLYYDRVGNSALKPEKASQINVGVTYREAFDGIVDEISIQADAFYNKVKDKIVALPTLFVWRMFNVGEVEIRGADINVGGSLSFGAGVRVKVQGNYSYQKALDVTDPKGKNYRHQIPYTPRHSANAMVTVLNRWANVGYVMSVVGNRFALPQNVRSNVMQGYVEHSVSVGREFRVGCGKWSMQVECLNITDKQYDVIQYYPMPGRSLRATLKFEY